MTETINLGDVMTAPTGPTPPADRVMLYIAGPYSNPDPVANTNHAIEIADSLTYDFEDWVTPIIPHLCLMWHLVTPQPVEFWYEYDLGILARCDALYRMGGESSGADREVEYAREHGISVYLEFDELQRDLAYGPYNFMNMRRG